MLYVSFYYRWVIINSPYNDHLSKFSPPSKTHYSTAIPILITHDSVMIWERFSHVLGTKYRQFHNFVVTGGTVSCRCGNLRCHQSQQSCQIEELLCSVCHIDLASLLIGFDFSYIIPLQWRHNERLKSPASRLFAEPFVQAQVKVHDKAPCHWPLWG